MNKKDLQKRIKEVEESIAISKDNKAKAEQHIEEGEIIIEAFKERLKCTSTS